MAANMNKLNTMHYIGKPIFIFMHCIGFENDIRKADIGLRVHVIQQKLTTGDLHRHLFLDQ